MAIFGSQDEGSGGTHTITTGSTPNIVGTIFQISENGDADSISAFISYTAGFSFNFADVKCAIYKHSDLSLIGVTEQKHFTSAASAHWETFDFASPPALTASTDYILVVWGVALATAAPSLLVYHAGDSATDVSHRQSQALNGFPDPLVPIHQDNTDAIFCTYTPSGAAGTLRLIKISGTFVDKPIKIKVAGTFVDKPIKIKVGGTFQDA